MLRLTKFLGKLVLRDIPPRVENCTTIKGLLEAIPEIYDVETPGGANLVGIFKSSSVPSSDLRDQIWLRTTGDGTPLAFAFFLSGRWIEFPFKNLAVWLSGNYASQKEELNRNGFFLMDGSIAGIPDMKDLFEGTSPNWTRFAVSFVGPVA